MESRLRIGATHIIAVIRLDFWYMTVYGPIPSTIHVYANKH